MTDSTLRTLQRAGFVVAVLAIIAFDALVMMT